MDWDKLGAFIGLVTPLILGVGAWVVEARNKRKRKKTAPEVLQGMPVDYETDYVTLLKQNLREERLRRKAAEKENERLRAKLMRSDNGNSDSR